MCCAALATTPRYIVMDTCGGSAIIPRWPTASATIFSHRPDAVSAAGGQYRLCWCAAEVGCSLSAHYRTDFGELVLVGPAPLAQDRGQRWARGSKFGRSGGLARDQVPACVSQCGPAIVVGTGDVHATDARQSVATRRRT